MPYGIGMSCNRNCLALVCLLVQLSLLANILESNFAEHFYPFKTKDKTQQLRRPYTHKYHLKITLF